MKSKNYDDKWLYQTPITHRGLFDENFPENTAPAFEKAIELGYGIEMDVQMTADNVLVVYHDNNLKRVCGVDKDIRELTYEEVKELRPMAKEYPILTFKEFLDLVGGSVPVLVEVKHQKRPGIEKLLVEPIFVRPNVHLDTLLDEFKKKRTHMAVVQSKELETLGILTMEDIIEELVGDLDNADKDGDTNE